MLTKGSVRWAERAHRGATIVLVLLALVKAAVVNERTPLWDLDAWRQAAPMAGIGPATGVGIDLAVVLLAAVALLAASMRGHRVRTGWLALGCAGGAAVLLHAWLAGPTWLEVIAPEGGGSAWLAAVAAMLACAHVSRDRWLYRLVVGLSLGFVGCLLAKGLVQVFVEHPQTVRTFRLNREEILAARGWDEGSAAARSFERRLMQPEATGWFGLSNVYASFMAAGLVGFGSAAVAWVVRTRGAVADRGWQVLVFGAACAAVGLWFSGSKGGVGAVLVAGGGVALVRTVRLPLVRRWNAPALIGPAFIGLVLAGVAARGVIGTAIGELSVLFRAFYAEAALRVFALNPLVGVGPGGFQDAYLISKPPISPEAVASPHSILLDWLAMLGIGGLAWGVLFVLVSKAVGRGIARGRGLKAGGGAGYGVSWRALFLLAGVVVLVGVVAERYATTVEVAGGRAVGLVVWVGLAAAIVNRVPAFALRLVAAAAGLTLVVHTQIEMTGVQPESAVLALAMVGLGAAPVVRTSSASSRGWGGVLICRGLIYGSVVAAGVPLGVAVVQLATWQASLLSAAERVAPMAEATRLGQAVGGSAAVEMLRAAEADLTDAVARRPGHEPTVKALGRTAGVRGSTEVGVAGRASAGAEGLGVSVDSARAFVALADTASAHGWLAATTRAAAASGSLDPSSVPALLAESERALLRAAELDPYGVPPAFRLAEYYGLVGSRAEAAGWARETLVRDGLTGLDPLVGLTEDQRGLMEALATED
ncbi:MAG: O-antigen ligase family protein [Planctomycetota bacterium]